MDPVGFIGLGNMGMPMAANLLAAAHGLIVHDLREESVAHLVGRGATSARSPAAVADAASIVFVSLPTPEVVEQVVSGTRGILAGRRAEIIVDLSTTGPAATARIIGRFDRPLDWVDAPVSGGVAGATAATLALMVSGPEATVARVRPLLDLLGRVTLVGDRPGLGQTMKLVNNLLAGGALALTAEALAMGAKAGLRPEIMIEVLNGASGRNTATADKFPRSVLNGRFDYGFAASLMHKDIGLFVDEAEAMGLSLPAAGAIRRLWRELLDEMGDGDFTTIAKLMERRAGVSLRASD